MLKILQAGLQPYVNQELLNVPVAFRTGRGTRGQIGNICWVRRTSASLTISPVQFRCSVVSGSWHPRLPCPSPILGAHSNSCPSGRWWHNHPILCRPPLLPTSIFLSIRVVSNESVLLISWPAYWSFSFCINPSNEHSGLISFRMDCLDFSLQLKELSRVFSNTTVQKQ